MSLPLLRQQLAEPSSRSRPWRLMITRCCLPVAFAVMLQRAIEFPGVGRLRAAGLAGRRKASGERNKETR